MPVLTAIRYVSEHSLSAPLSNWRSLVFLVFPADTMEIVIIVPTNFLVRLWVIDRRPAGDSWYTVRNNTPIMAGKLRCTRTKWFPKARKENFAQVHIAKRWFIGFMDDQHPEIDANTAYCGPDAEDLDSGSQIKEPRTLDSRLSQRKIDPSSIRSTIPNMNECPC